MSQPSKTFSYVKYDEHAKSQQEIAKVMMENLEDFISRLGAGRPQSLAMTKLEECYMWIGKAIRDQQYRRLPETPHQPERGE